LFFSSFLGAADFSGMKKSCIIFYCVRSLNIMWLGTIELQPELEAQDWRDTSALFE
jgi:hypothetical protein